MIPEEARFQNLATLSGFWYIDDLSCGGKPFIVTKLSLFFWLCRRNCKKCPDSDPRKWTIHFETDFALIVLFYFPQLQAWKDSTPNNKIQSNVGHDDSVQVQRGSLTGLEKFSQYIVGIIAYNGAGDSPRSDTKIIKTEEGGNCFNLSYAIAVITIIKGAIT